MTQTQTAQRNVTQGCQSTSQEALKRQAWECKPSSVAGKSAGIHQQNESIVQGANKRAFLVAEMQTPDARHRAFWVSLR